MDYEETVRVLEEARERVRRSGIPTLVGAGFDVHALLEVCKSIAGRTGAVAEVEGIPREVAEAAEIATLISFGFLLREVVEEDA